MNKEEIALQITLKSIDKIKAEFYRNTLDEDTIKFSNQVVSFYNNIYENLKLDNQSSSLEETVSKIKSY